MFFRRCKCNSHGLACNELNGLNCSCVDNTISSCDPLISDCRNEQVTHIITNIIIFTNNLLVYSKNND